MFGPLLGVVYVGRFYLAFRSRERVRMLTRHFDQLVREAEVEARDFPDWVEELAQTIPADADYRKLVTRPAP